MTIRHLRSTVAATTLALLHPVPAAVQAVAWGEPPPAHRIAPPAARYHVRLESAWPQLTGADGCVNGGSETLEGVLTRVSPDRYEGTFTRHTRLLFCGAHGGSGAACRLELEGDGTVAVRAAVLPDPRAPDGRAVRVAWAPSAGHAAAVSGACDGAFKQRVREMYLTARHGLEFALPKTGAAPRRERLEDYPWFVVVE